MREIAGKPDLWQFVADKKPQIENALHEYQPLAPAKIETKFNEVVRYVLFSGGKRLRPMLTLLGAELVGGESESIVPAACAIEFIHTSSLIFDDLPCMDDSDERRGNASLHARFGEGLAVLVAVGLLNAAYHLVFVNHKNSERAIEAHFELVECVGAAGMIGGQSVDLALAKGASLVTVSGEDYEFETIRNLKTSALMRLALKVGAILAGANQFQLAQLSRFAGLLGDAYQLSDDLLDLEEDGKLFESNKTFAAGKGQMAAQAKLKTIIAEAKQVLTENFSANEARDYLNQLTDYLAERKN